MQLIMNMCLSGALLFQVAFKDTPGHDVSQEEEADDEDGGGAFEVDEDSDEEYIPAAEPSSVPPSGRRNKVNRKAEKKENGEATEDDPKKASVQCPVCNKTFRSKYYLKVHNRYGGGVTDGYHLRCACFRVLLCSDLTLSWL